MNYFELFDIPVSFTIDRALLGKRLIALQKKYHPDFYGQGSEDERAEALEMSSLANAGYKVLQNEEATIKYLLQLHGLLEEEEKYQLPPDFLMVVMELNEMKMDGADTAAIQQEVSRLLQEIKAEVQPVLDHYDAQTAPAALQKVKEWYFKKKYLDRLLAD
ncbi:MAG TPA: iron-sulfur cluster co-chaperone HscB C-terminal domain-containing protein [Phnomibacter sp.]|nr:iron-sulfur cluster co-chaperone HscB C-terminal domain-containing protein [Phnomibacter sp.]